jgi:hypothetical protein
MNPDDDIKTTLKRIAGPVDSAGVWSTIAVRARGRRQRRIGARLVLTAVVVAGLAMGGFRLYEAVRPHHTVIITSRTIANSGSSNQRVLLTRPTEEELAAGRLVLSTPGTPAAVLGVMPDGSTIGIADPGRNGNGTYQLFDQEGSLLLTRAVIYLFPHDSPFIAFRSLAVASRSVSYLLLEHQDGFKIDENTVVETGGESTRGMHLGAGATASEVVFAGGDVRVQGGESGGLSYAVMVDGKSVPEPEQSKLAKPGLAVGDTWVTVSSVGGAAQLSAHRPKNDWQAQLQAPNGYRLGSLRVLGEDEAGNLHVLASVESTAVGRPHGPSSFGYTVNSPIVVRVVFSPRGAFLGQQAVEDVGSHLYSSFAMDGAGTMYLLGVGGTALEVRSYPMPVPTAVPTTEPSPTTTQPDPSVDSATESSTTTTTRSVIAVGSPKLDLADITQVRVENPTPLIDNPRLVRLLCSSTDAATIRELATAYEKAVIDPAGTFPGEGTQVVLGFVRTDGIELHVRVKGEGTDTVELVVGAQGAKQSDYQSYVATAPEFATLARRLGAQTPAGLGPLPATRPPDFGFVLAYGVDAHNVIDTFAGTFTKDLVSGLARYALAQATFTPAELDTFYQRFAQIHIETYPELYGPVTNVFQTPYTTYYLRLRAAGREQIVRWADAHQSQEPEAVKLRQLLEDVQNAIQAKPAVKALPPAHGGYM